MGDAEPGCTISTAKELWNIQNGLTKGRQPLNSEHSRCPQMICILKFTSERDHLSALNSDQFAGS